MKVKADIRENINPAFQFDTGDLETDAVKTRITSSTAGFEDYFDRPVQDEVPTAEKTGPTASITTQDAPLTPGENKDFIQRLIDFGKGGVGKAIVGATAIGTAASAVERLEAAEERIEAGEGEMPAYLKEGARFVAEEVTPVGLVPPVEAAIGAGLEAGAEAMQEEAEEKGIAGDIEAQFRGLFGVPPQY